MLPFLFYPLLTSFNGQSIVYNNGYPTTYKGKSLTWSRGKLVTYNNGYGTNFNYTYDVNGRKTKVERGISEICYFFYDGDKLVAEHWYTPSGTTPFVKVHYLYDDQGIVGFKAYKNGENNNNYEYFTVSTDILGNVVRIDNANGWVTKISYDAFGAPTYKNNTNNTPALGYSPQTFFKLAYKGYYYDPDLKLYYLMSRYYDPETGRFISPDHIDYLDPQALLGTNLYAYCKNNPIMYSDPVGHFPLLVLAVALLFTPIGGATLQVATSIVSYVGMAISSIFDKDIRNDMNSIGWNPFNTNETATLNSKKVSFYKGVPIIKTKKGKRSGSFGIIFLSKGSNADTLRHERGHNSQLMMMGIANYGLMIGLPSWQEWSNKPYYERPWEITADVLGGVTGRSHSQSNINNGYQYLYISAIFGPVAYLFLLNEY